MSVSVPGTRRPGRSTGIGIPAPGLRGRQLAATDSPNAARHSWGPYASPSTWYWYTRVLQWRLAVLARPPNLILAQSGAAKDDSRQLRRQVLQKIAQQPGRM